MKLLIILNKMDLDKIINKCSNYSIDSNTKSKIYKNSTTYTVSSNSIDNKILTLNIKLYTYKIILPAIIGTYKVFALNKCDRFYLGESSSDGVFEFNNIKRVTLEQPYQKLINAGLFKENDLHGYINLEIIPNNNNWFNFINKLHKNYMHLDNFIYKYNKIYISAVCIQRNPILEVDNKMCFYIK